MTLWLLARSAGYVALLAATLSVVLGALGSSGHRLTTAATAGSAVEQADRRLLCQLLHRSSGVITLAMLALHVTLLVADRYVAVGVVGALVPFTAGFRGFALGLGTLAAYGFVVTAASGALRRRWVGPERAPWMWRLVHLSSYGAWVLAMGHGVLAGTDTGQWWSLALYGACLIAVCWAAWRRLGALADDLDSPLRAARRRELVNGARR